MNILFLALDVDLGNERGESVHVRELATNLSALGHSVRLVVAGLSGELPGVEIYERPASTAAQLRRGRELAARWADVLYERRTSPKVGAAIATFAGIPFVVEVNGVLEDEIGHPVGGVFRGWVRRRMFRRAAAVVAVSPGIRDDMVRAQGLVPERVFVVANGANVELFRPLDRGAARMELGLREDARLVCFVGNLAHWQGVDILLRAASVLTSQVPGFELLIVGEGDAMTSLRALANDLGLAATVHFVGRVPYERVALYVGASDVCVAPFRAGRKASPIKVYEYLACARPVVACDVDDIGNFLSATKSGKVVPPNEPAELAAALHELLSDRTTAEEMGRRGREAVLRTASWRETATRVSAVLESARLHR